MLTWRPITELAICLPGVCGASGKTLTRESGREELEVREDEVPRGQSPRAQLSAGTLQEDGCLITSNLPALSNAKIAESVSDRSTNGFPVPARPRTLQSSNGGISS